MRVAFWFAVRFDTLVLGVLLRQISSLPGTAR